MQQPVAHEQRDAPDTCWNFDDDDGDRLAETLLILPGAFSGPVRFRRAIGTGWNGLGTSQVRGQAFDISRGGHWSRSRQAQLVFCAFKPGAMHFRENGVLAQRPGSNLVERTLSAFSLSRGV